MRKSLIYGVLTLAVFAVATTAAVAAPTRVHATKQSVAKKPITPGFYKGKQIGYFDYGPIKLKPGNKVAPIWAVTNGAAGQRNIVDTVPGQADYSPLWQLNMVTFKSGVTPYLLEVKGGCRHRSAEGRCDHPEDQDHRQLSCPRLRAEEGGRLLQRKSHPLLRPWASQSYSGERDCAVVRTDERRTRPAQHHTRDGVAQPDRLSAALGNHHGDLEGRGAQDPADFGSADQEGAESRPVDHQEDDARRQLPRRSLIG